VDARKLEVTIRSVQQRDLDVLFEHQLDPEANAMAAFTAADPTDRAAFDAHWQRLLNDAAITNRTILAAGEVAGHIAAYKSDDLDGPEVTYWIGKRWWGQGVATRAVEQLLAEVQARPLYGRCAETNPASRRVLEKCGFSVVAEDEGFANAPGKVVREYILRLDS
jgi:RimJ/RimL family protein N-acetyltransferase